MRRLVSGAARLTPSFTRTSNSPVASAQRRSPDLADKETAIHPCALIEIKPPCSRLLRRAFGSCACDLGDGWFVGSPFGIGVHMLDHRDCVQIERQFGSPFYLLNRQEFIDNFRRFEQAFRSRHNRVRIGYSYKTNFLPYLCRLVRDLGGYAEVVSRLEYDLALYIGQDPAQIIFNGPIKSYEDVELALRNGSLVQLDNQYEIDKVLEFVRRQPGVPVRVGLRVNMDLTDDEGTSHIQDGLGVSRFGFPTETLEEAASRLRSVGVALSSLHGHASSSTRQPWIFERITRTLCQSAEALGPESIEEINIGGGFFGKLPPGFGPPDAPSFDDYAEAVVGALHESPWARRRRPWLVLEPGVALVANTLSFITRVWDVKEVQGRRFAIVDGSVFHSKPSQHKKPQPFCIIAPAGAAREEKLWSVTGSTCMEKDRLLDDVQAALAPGDYVRIDNVGAYTIVMSPTFIHPAPAIVVHEEDGFRPVRVRQSFEHAFANYRP